MAFSFLSHRRICFSVFAMVVAVGADVVCAGEASTGQDIVVTAIPGVINYESETPPGSPEPLDAFAIGTICCNAGDETMPFVGSDNQHAILRQGMFRLMNGRFEQIGTSWIKHIYPAANEPGTCGIACVNPNVSGDELRPGCTDSNSAGLNGDRVHTTRSYEINPFSASFPYPTSNTHAEGTIAQRIQVHHSDLNPALNPGASYFVEAHYLHPGDAADGNADNNATFARVTPSDPGTGTYVMTITSPALNRGQTKPAILAWVDADSSVTVTAVRVPNEGLFWVAAKATSIGGGFWHYEYAIENLNSDRAGQWFHVPLPDGALVQNVGFHDVDYHSGEPLTGVDWTVLPITNAVAWTTGDFAVNPTANALRWSTLYNFRFDANVGPSPTTATLGLFKPGTPEQVEFETIGPALGFMDCNGNQRLDACDVNCASGACPAPCGVSGDCNANGLPDECETDCNANGQPDDCDREVTLDTQEFLSALKRASLLTNEESKGVRLSFHDGGLTLSSRAPEQGEATISLPVAYKGDTIDIGFNPVFLTDMLRAVHTDEITFAMKEPNRPGLVRVDKGFLHVVMPVNLSSA